MIQILTGIQPSTTALEAERTRLDVISQNIANAHTTRGPNGQPYQRQVVVFETALQQALAGQGAAQSGGVRVSRIESDHRAPLMIQQPGHPDADSRGMVAMPNINLHEEMADMISASRAFEANLSVIKNARSMALQSLSIGKR